jgi:drug/metabolite transporter (DMT)-like permease
MVVLESLAAALCYAMASVFQQNSAAQAPPEDALRVSLLVGLVRRPLWLLGIVADVAGFLLQFVALGHGSLVLVQPLLVCGLLFALPLSAAINDRRWMTGREWLGSGVVVAGLATFLAVANPAPGASTTSGLAWVIVSLSTLIPALCLGAASQSASPAVASTMQATAAGFLYGLAAALTKTVSYVATSTSGSIPHILLQVFITWQTYALVGVGLGSLILSQTAFQAGPLGWSLPALSAVDPVVSIVVGALAFSEPIDSAAWAVAVETVGLALLVGGVLVLNRSELGPPAPDSEAERIALSG